MINQLDSYTLNPPWDEPPLSFLTHAQQLELQQHAEVSRYLIGEVLWSSQSSQHQILVVEGNVRLIQPLGNSTLDGKTMLLKPGSWVGDQLELAGQWKARAASHEVILVQWRSQLWHQIESPELQKFWTQMSWHYQPIDLKRSQPASVYPYIPSLNTASACLAMVLQQVQAPLPLQQVSRQLRGQLPRDVVAAGEQLGLNLCHIQAAWSSLSALSFPALLHWRQQHWVVVYEAQGNRLIIADPQNHPKQKISAQPSQTEMALKTNLSSATVKIEMTVKIETTIRIAWTERQFQRWLQSSSEWSLRTFGNSRCQSRQSKHDVRVGLLPQRHHRIGEDCVPLTERLIGCDEQTFTLIPVSNEFKQYRGFSLGLFDVAQIVEDKQIKTVKFFEQQFHDLLIAEKTENAVVMQV